MLRGIDDFIIFLLIMVTGLSIVVLLGVAVFNASSGITKKNLINSCTVMKYFYIDEKTAIKCEVVNANEK
jgi:hypothetical protein